MLACWVGVSGIKHHGGLCVSCCSLLQVLWAREGTKAEVGSWGEMSPAGLCLCLSLCPTGPRASGVAVLQETLQSGTGLYLPASVRMQAVSRETHEYVEKSQSSV